MEDIIMAIFFGSAALSIPIVAMVLSHKRKFQDKINRKLELQKEILELEIKKQDGTMKLLEEESKKLDKVIDGADVNIKRDESL